MYFLCTKINNYDILFWKGPGALLVADQIELLVILHLLFYKTKVWIWAFIINEMNDIRDIFNVSGVICNYSAGENCFLMKCSLISDLWLLPIMCVQSLLLPSTEAYLIRMAATIMSPTPILRFSRQYPTPWHLCVLDLDNSAIWHFCWYKECIKWCGFWMNYGEADQRSLLKPKAFQYLVSGIKL